LSAILDYFRHLCWWLRDFPLPGECLHAYSSIVGGTEETCLLCGKTQVKSKEDLLDDAELLAKHPEWVGLDVDY